MFDTLDIKERKKVYFTHLNHTNNALDNSTEEKKGDLMEDHDKTEENVYPGTHWTLWILGLISIAALVAFVMHLKI